MLRELGQFYRCTLNVHHLAHMIKIDEKRVKKLFEGAPLTYL